MVWYSHHFKSFQLFIIIQTVKDFSIVNETKVDVFLEFPCFLSDPANDVNVPLPFLNPAWMSGSSWFV